jgi:hypothetical protein
MKSGARNKCRALRRSGKGSLPGEPPACRIPVEVTRIDRITDVFHAPVAVSRARSVSSDEPVRRDAVT